MTYTRGVGQEQNYSWIKHEPSVQKLLDIARDHLKADQFAEASSVLMPLIADGNPEALYLGAWYSWGDDTAEAFERRYLDWLTKSAMQEYPPALFVLGVYYNTGELVSVDKAKAAQLFKRAAELKHAASQYSHALDLLYGTNGIERNEAMGFKYLLESKEAKFRGAFELLAYFYEKGEFGFPIDPQKAASLRAEADGDDVIGWY
ncbi:MAG: sel1 repeat family protein [Deltaproteobacteria bacterium]|nr:MAG: sel1 repeat family protein [Deltaproteobacteria bacterium]